MARSRPLERSLERTVWTHAVAAQLSRFAATESASSIVLVISIVAALVWANAAPASYAAVWALPLTFELGGASAGMDLREWVSDGLMTLFFLVVGLEARREIDLGALRDRKRLLIPVASGLTGMVVPVAIYSAINAGTTSASGWGVAMSTDTALALGLLAVVRRNLPEKVRGFLVTVFIVDDIVALIVIAVGYSRSVQILSVAWAALVFAVIPFVLRRVLLPSVFYVTAGLVSWSLLLMSGIDPVVVGLATGLAAPAYSPKRIRLEQAAGIFRRFREQPSSRMARVAATSLVRTTSPNERLQSLYHPWVSYLIVPLFALSNAGVRVDASSLDRAYASPVTLGIIAGYVIGKPVAVIGVSSLIERLSRHRLTPPVGWAAVAGSGTIAGVGFTVAVLVASLAFTGPMLDDAKIGLLTATVVSSMVTWAVFKGTALLSPEKQTRALLGSGQGTIDLQAPVDPARDHVRGPAHATVTVVEYGDFECPFCGRAEPSIRDLVDAEDVRFVWRHLPIREVHAHAEFAAEASEVAAARGLFWEMHDLLLEHQDHLRAGNLFDYAEKLGLDRTWFETELLTRKYRARVQEDVASADLSGASGTPTFFINGRRHYGSYDAATLQNVVRVARDHARSVMLRR